MVRVGEWYVLRRGGKGACFPLCTPFFFVHSAALLVVGPKGAAQSPAKMYTEVRFRCLFAQAQVDGERFRDVARPVNQRQQQARRPMIVEWLGCLRGWLYRVPLQLQGLLLSEAGYCENFLS